MIQRKPITSKAVIRQVLSF